MEYCGAGVAPIRDGSGRQHTRTVETLRGITFDGEAFDLVQLWSCFAFQPIGNVGFDFFGNIGGAIDFANARKGLRVER